MLYFKSNYHNLCVKDVDYLSTKDYFDAETGHYVRVDSDSSHWFDLTTGEEGLYNDGGSYYNYTKREDGLYSGNSSSNLSTGKDTLHNFQNLDYTNEKKTNVSQNETHYASSGDTFSASLWEDFIKPSWKYTSSKKKKKIIIFVSIWILLTGLPVLLCVVTGHDDSYLITYIVNIITKIILFFKNIFN